ncbi:MAG: restriction endonuclease [Phenylobacterium sp.]|uniref:restriction endonuclease n=1 Tax=Phenylobacterium sp. TaxID=1871053 RepID=UPI002732ACF8|nr:restriction endonuclease [Phenylobacterium sp.]MDP3746890.1 restriction endonuclease [Phenylobacterium sp.]
MDADTLAEIDATLARLADQSARLSPRDAEHGLASVLKPLLAASDYQLKQNGGPQDPGVDFVITRAANSDAADDIIGLEFKYYSHAIQRSAVAEVLGMAMLNAFDRVVLVSNANFSAAARAAVERAMPVKVELLGFDDLKAWAAALRSDSAEDNLDISGTVRALVKALSAEFAQLIARNVETLRALEWRQLEETMAEVFENLGFKTTLTPGSKDGGKDLVLEYQVAGVTATFYVEIKHWRSSTKVGSGVVQDFLKVIVRDARKGGLLLSSYGFNDNAFEGLTEIERRTLHHGDKMKIFGLCQYYEKSKRGLWSAPDDLGTLLTGEISL